MNLNLRVDRQTFSHKSTTGELLVDGIFYCFTLEPARAEGDIKPRCIPAGLYDVKIRYSEKHKRAMPHVENVPGFEGIEIHPGNKPEDTEGCLLVGKMLLPDFVGNSREVFDPLFDKLQSAQLNGNDIFITYRDLA